jgi:hypothetical protein
MQTFKEGELHKIYFSFKNIKPSVRRVRDIMLTEGGPNVS